ncbi:AraC family transcriptional regulator [Leucobacter sp. UCMA 4100]|uniref:helix-turn-helix domain-containing protein n=1 Tax=Leucobacter sp. UCMA 4100 TaxID=2810534 RepID=UPI0022EA1183|nr:AraC family transcriptional regulator [Leucobacter sp. UCMA 4100]MDA3147302.1 AraC family transcriptional regulator [Leucobacter sp. UCMA 4100]
MSARPVIPVHTIIPREGWGGGSVLIVESLGQDDTARPTHRHAFVQFIVIEAGEGQHLIDFEPVAIVPGDVHIVAPGQVHSWSVGEGFCARALMFSEDMLDTVGSLPDQIRELTMLGAAPVSPGTKAVGQIHRLLDAIELSTSQESNGHLVAAVLWESLAGYGEHIARAERSTLTRQYLKQVLCRPSAAHSVGGFARQLGVTTGYLSEQVVHDTGSTPGRILRTALSREAQRLLTATELSAAQISTRLGFSEPSYFSRFFRREVGCTPTDYRETRLSQQYPDAKEQHVG